MAIVNQIIAAVMLFGIVTVVFAPLIIESGSQIFSKSVGISDAMDTSRSRTGQIMVVTNTYQHGGTITVHVSNIGIEDIKIHTVLVDGIESSYVAKNQDGTATDMLEPGSLGTLEINGSGDVIQVITSVGKLFEFKI